MKLGWRTRVFFQSWQKELNYKADFWVNFVGRMFVALVIPFFMWSAILASMGSTTFQGMDLKDLALYYALANAVFATIQSSLQSGLVSTEIYQGGLSRYLLYPLSFQQYTLTSYLGIASAYGVQLIIVYTVAYFISPTFSAPGFPLASSLAQGILLTIAGNFLIFFLFFLLECIAFWADRVWSLFVMARFMISFFGGRLLPLKAFPLWFQNALEWTPFPHFVAGPVGAFMGKLTWEQTLTHLVAIGVWAIIFWAIGQLLYRQGLKSYSGVGI